MEEVCFVFLYGKKNNLIPTFCFYFILFFMFSCLAFSPLMCVHAACCVYVCVCMIRAAYVWSLYMYAFRFICSCVCAGARGGHWVSCSVTFHFLCPLSPWDRVSHWTWSYAGGQKAPVILLSSHPMLVRLQMCVTMSDFLCGFCGFELRTCITSVLTHWAISPVPFLWK